ncbi:MAG: hypothetical protein HKN87_02555 [Saprospiraceae bacterium]|nr:hypothetical protein [Saprospiraceae bacterium]
MKLLSLFLSIICYSSLVAQQEVDHVDALVTPRFAKRTVTVGSSMADVAGFSNQSIQFAIDALAKVGGTIKLTEGIFKINAPIRMRSNVTLQGAGKGTILRKGTGVQTRFIVDADYGELKLTVEDVEGFRIGMKVQISDEDNSSCWNVSAAYVTDIQDNVIYISDGLIRDYRSDRNGYISDASSVIEVIGLENVYISNLTADGNGSENFLADGCNSAGILVLRSKHVTVDSVHVKDFNGEGISWQITEHVTIRNSEISGSGNTGLHPGTGSPYSIIENNNIHHSNTDGLFICWRAYHSQVRGNKFHHNERFGICTGHKDTDVIFSENHIFENGSDGVNLRHERKSNAPHRNTFVKNIIENNGVQGGGYGFSINSPAMDLVLKENSFRNGKQSQKAAVYIYANGSEPTLENNEFGSHSLGDVVYEQEEK